MPGLRYVPDFISPEEEERLTEKIDGCEWRTDLKRNVCNTTAGATTTPPVTSIPPCRLGPLPYWADSIGRRWVADQFPSAPPDQVIVNEYKANHAALDDGQETDKEG